MRPLFGRFYFRIRLLPQAAELLLDFFEFVIRKRFEIYQVVASALERANQFVEFQMNRLRVTVLRILN